MAKIVEVELPENLTIGKIQSVHEYLESLIDDDVCDTFELRASHIDRIDTSGIQLLCSFIAAANKRQIKTNWHEPSEDLQLAAKALGVSKTLGIH